MILGLFWASGAGAVLIDNGDGTVSDTHTGLMWQQESVATTMDWEAALTYCETLALPVNSAYTDWHLPDTQELQSLVDYSGQNPTAINSNFFPGTADYDYWTSTTYNNYGNYVWTVHFGDGRITFLEKSAPAYVRAVRWQNDAEVGHQYKITPITHGRGYIDPGSAFNAGISESPVLILTPYNGWHLELDNFDSTLPGILAEDDNHPGTYSFTLAPVFGSGTITANYVWDSNGDVNDSDNDGIDDAWEIDIFGDLITANHCSDFDHDGFRDIFEFRHDWDDIHDTDGNWFNPTDPNPAYLALIDPQGDGTYHSISGALLQHINEPLVIRIRAGQYFENLEIGDYPITLIIRGGFNSDFSAQTGVSVINGTLTISGGPVVIENLVIK